MIQSASPRSALHEAHQKLFEAARPTKPAPGDGANMDSAAPPRDAAPEPRGVVASGPQDQSLSISVDDWDRMFRAVETRLRRAVGEQQNTLSDMPENSAVLVTSQVQAVVLDCVDALGQLHAALKQDRDQHLAA